MNASEKKREFINQLRFQIIWELIATLRKRVEERVEHCLSDDVEILFEEHIVIILVLNRKQNIHVIPCDSIQKFLLNPFESSLFYLYFIWRQETIQLLLLKLANRVPKRVTYNREILFQGKVSMPSIVFRFSFSHLHSHWSITAAAPSSLWYLRIRNKSTSYSSIHSLYSRLRMIYLFAPFFFLYLSRIHNILYDPLKLHL